MVLCKCKQAVLKINDLLILENNVVLFVFEDCTAIGSDGRRYVDVVRKTSGDDVELLGWTPDSDKTVIL